MEVSEAESGTARVLRRPVPNGSTKVEWECQICNATNYASKKKKSWTCRIHACSGIWTERCRYFDGHGRVDREVGQEVGDMHDRDHDRDRELGRACRDDRDRGPERDEGPQTVGARTVAVDNRPRIPTHQLAMDPVGFQKKVRTRMVLYMTFWGWALVAIMARPIRVPLSAQVQSSNT